MRRLALGLWTALLPASEREPLLERLDLDVPTVGASWALGAAQVAVLPVWALLGVSYAERVAGVQSGAILAMERPPTFTEAMLASVALGPLAFVFSPMGLLLEYVIVSGIVRLAGLVAADRPTGDAIVTFLAWARRAGTAEARRRRRLRALGPWRPDRIVQEGAHLVVLAARDKPDWNERVTIERSDSFYRLAHREDRPRDDGRGVEVAYVLRQRQPGELIRALIRIDDPPDREEDAG